MNISLYVIALAAAVTSVGCSTITQSETQPLSLTASYQEKPVEVQC